MTGNEIAVMRQMLGPAAEPWSREDFGQLVGASPSAVFRWEEQGGEDAKLDPRFRTVLSTLRELLDRDPDETRSYLEAIRRQGSIRGLYMLFGLYYDRPHFKKGRRDEGDLPWRKDVPPLSDVGDRRTAALEATDKLSGS